MQLLPAHTKEYILPYDLENTKAYLKTFVNQPVNLANEEADNSQMLFNGVMMEDSFCISLKVEKSHSFLPLINGKLIPFEDKCLVLCSFGMFSSTRVFYIFWLVVTLFSTVLLTYMARPDKALIAFLLLVANIVITNLSFDRQVKRTLETLDKVFISQTHQ